MFVCLWFPVTIHGAIHTYFNKQTNGTYHQFYHFEKKSNNITFSDTIEILDNTNIQTYLQILSMSGQPLENTQIRIKTENSTLNQWNEGKLIGQLLTDTEGNTYFWSEAQQTLRLEITKTGYELKILKIETGTINSTKLSPIIIKLQPTNLPFNYNHKLIFPSQFTNRSLNILGTLYAPDTTNITYYTTYYTTPTTVPTNTLGSYPINLTSGLHFNEEGTDNIDLTITIDGTPKTLTINYLDTEDLLTPTNLTSNIAIPLYYILLLLITIVITKVLNNSNAGTHTFLIGGIALSLLATEFLFLTLMCALHYGLRTIKTVISE